MLVTAALLALSIGGALEASLRSAVVCADVLFAVAVAFDFMRTPRPDRLSVRRRVPERAGLSQDFARSLRIDVNALPRAAGLELEIHEEFPAAFDVRARTLRSPRVRSAATTNSASGAERNAARASTRNDALDQRASTRSYADHDAAPLLRGLDPPLEGDPSGGPDVTLLPSSGPIDLVRVYRSSRRGVHALGDMRLRLRGRLGLVQRQARMHGEHAIAIEPALLGLKRTLRLAASERWRDLGLRYVRRRGGMTEFESLREHVHGDDLRLVDWKAFAKRGRPIVRQFQEERGQEMILVFDCGRRMSATSEELATSASQDSNRARKTEAHARPTAGWTKLDHALDAGLQIAAVALQRGDRVGVMAFDSQVRAFVQPSRGARQLERLRDAVFALEASTLESDLERALRELALRHRRRALVLILSDIADPLSIERQRVALATGSRRHTILFATLDDPSLRAAADGSAHVDAAVRAAAMELENERRQSLRRLSRTGVRVLDTLPAEAAVPLLAAWLEARRSSA
jgi:uncharacterized protein (DUF58 family)